MHIAIMLLNAGRGSGEVARQHARQLLALGNRVTFMHPGIGVGVEGAVNVDIVLPGEVTPVHEYLPSAGPQQKAVSLMESTRLAMSGRARSRAQAHFDTVELTGRLSSWLGSF